VFAELAEEDGEDLAAQATSAAGKALVLATSTDLACTVAEKLNVDSWPVLGKDDVERNLEAFTDQQHAILALAGRYDGIDLPDDACRRSRTSTSAITDIMRSLSRPRETQGPLAGLLGPHRLSVGLSGGGDGLELRGGMSPRRGWGFCGCAMRCRSRVGDSQRREALRSA